MSVVKPAIKPSAWRRSSHLHTDDGVDEEDHRDEQSDVRQRLEEQKEAEEV